MRAFAAARLVAPSRRAYPAPFAGACVAGVAGAPLHVSDLIRQYEEYVFARYVDGGDAEEDIDDAQVFEVLSAKFAQPEEASSGDCFMPGLLAFELAWGQEDEASRERLMRIAKFWFQRWKALSNGEEMWEPVDIRMADIEQYFSSRNIAGDAIDPFAGGAPAPAVAEAPVVRAPASYTVREEDQRGPMLYVPAGAFLFGPAAVAASTGAFWIDKFPVTNRQYDAFCRATGYRAAKFQKDPRFSHPDAPVVGVSVADAQKYASWIGKDLPTEEQWEKAARGVDGRAFPWGNDEAAGEAQACSGRDAATGGTAPVTASADGASPYGVRDMSGNVWEWTKSTVTDTEVLHVIKGGCYNDTGGWLRADARLEAAPKDKHENVGFRLVRPA